MVSWCSIRPPPSTCGNGRTTRSTTYLYPTCGASSWSTSSTRSWVRGRERWRTTAFAVAPTQLYALRVDDLERPSAVRVYLDSVIPGLSGTARFEWAALDAWFEEDEEVFVHPRNPYSRVDALRSTRRVRIELDGVVLAESSSPVMVFETGLPTRYYLNRTEVHFDHLVPTDTVTSCPYKGMTSQYWSVRVGADLHPDLAWSYDFPTRQLLPIAGLIAFYNEKVDVFVEGQQLERPTTHFSK